jgi:hypothetical protein
MRFSTGLLSVQTLSQLICDFVRPSQKSKSILKSGEKNRDENERNLLPPIEQYSHHGDLRHGRQSALTFISHLTVRITRTFSGSAVCIRKLEVWGRPSKSCSEHAVKKLMELYPKVLPMYCASLTLIGLCFYHMEVA